MNKLQVIGTAILKRHGFFSIDQIIRATKIPRRYCRDVLCLLKQEKIIKQVAKPRKEHVFGKGPVYAMIYRVLDRKRLAARIARRRYKNTVQDRMWFIIWNKDKNKGSFDLRNLVVLAGTKKGTARWYIKALRRAEYIVPSRKGGAPGVEWRLRGKFGPERPYIEYSRKRERDVKKRPI